MGPNMFGFLIGYAGLLLGVAVLVVWLLKTGLWYRYFLFFIYLLSFSVLNVAGMYALVHSVYISVPDVVHLERTLLGFFIMHVSFVVFLPLYLWAGPRRGLTAVVSKPHSWQQERGGLLTILLLWLIALSVVALHALLRGGKYPLLLMLQSTEPITASTIVELRTEYGFVEFHWFNIGFYYIPIFLTVYTFLLRRARHSLVNTVLFGGTFLLSAVLSVLFLFKGWLFWLFAALVIAKVLVDRRIRVSTIALIMFSLVAVGVAYKVYYPKAEPFSIARILTHRIIEVYTMSSGVAFGVFPDFIPFLGGVTIPNPGGLFPYEQVNLSRLIHSYLYGGAVGGAPVPHAVEGYVNFGYAGLALFAVFAQFCVFALTCLISSMRRDAYTVSLYVFASIWVMQLSMVNIFYGLLDLTVIVTFLLLLGVGRGLVPIVLSAGKSVHRRDRLQSRRLACTHVQSTNKIELS